MYWWLLRENGDKMTTAGKTREDAELRAAAHASHFGEAVTFESPEGERGTVQPSQVFRIDPTPFTKKSFKENVKKGLVYRAATCDATGKIIVAGEASVHGGAWVALVEVEKGYIKRVLR